MKREYCEAIHLEAHGTLTLRELEELSGLAEAMLRELVDYGALAPDDQRAPTWTFPGEVLTVVRTAGRLQRAFELDAPALALVLRMHEEMRALEAEVRRLRARLP